MGTILSPFRGPVLYTIARAVKPEVVVETGIASGISTTFILEALDKNRRGNPYSIGIPPHLSKNGTALPADKEIGWLVPKRLKNRWILIVGNSLKGTTHVT